MHCNHHLTSFTSEKMNVLMIIMKQLTIGLLLTQEQLTAMDAKPRYTKRVFLHIMAIKKILVILFFDILLRNSICFVLENLFVYEPVQLGSVVPETIVDLWKVWGLEDFNVCPKTSLVQRNELFVLCFQKNFLIKNNYLVSLVTSTRKLYIEDRGTVHKWPICHGWNIA